MCLYIVKEQLKKKKEKFVQNIDSKHILLHMSCAGIEEVNLWGEFIWKYNGKH